MLIERDSGEIGAAVHAAKRFGGEHRVELSRHHVGDVVAAARHEFGGDRHEPKTSPRCAIA